jgi:hypothetical protein
MTKNLEAWSAVGGIFAHWDSQHRKENHEETTMVAAQEYQTPWQQFSCSSRCVLFFLCVLWLSPSVFAQHSWYCDLSNEAIVDLEWRSDDASIAYAVADTDEKTGVMDGDGSRTRRHLREHITSIFPWKESIAPHLVSSNVDHLPSHRRMELKATQNDTVREDEKMAGSVAVVQSRLCHCSLRFMSTPSNDTFYCPMPSTHCLVNIQITTNEATIGCFVKSRKRSFISGVWPLVIAGFAVTLAALIGTPSGWNAINCVAVLVKPSRNTYLVHYLLQRNRYVAVLHIRSYLRNHADEFPENFLPEMNQIGRLRNVQNGGTREDSQAAAPALPPNQLALKTRIYRRRADSGLTDAMSTTGSLSAGRRDDSLSQQGGEANKDGDSANASISSSDLGDETENDHNNYDLEHACAICCGELLEGDRVGALSCQHNFHVECLKEWLTFRNVCPLCLQANVATPHRPVQELVDTTAPSVSANANSSINSRDREQEVEAINTRVGTTSQRRTEDDGLDG